jgi:site-specific DNA-methyltransferase (adenine-specific)
MQSNIIYHGDCVEILKTLPDDIIAACITDPPYNYEFIGRKWDHKEIQRRISRIQNSSTLVKNIPYGSGLAGGVRNTRWYKRNRENILEYQRWSTTWGQQVFRVCKSGAYVAVFSSTRTVAHVQVALEEAGFYARDCLVFRRPAGIPKGLNIEKKLAKEGDPHSKQWKGWHSCLRNEWEAIALLQKPLLNNYAETVKETGVGLIQAVNSNGSFQSNILEGFQRDDIESFDVHCTVKPVSLMKKLISMFVPVKPDNIVLDPFAGSGTTLVAARLLAIPFIGIEIEEEYVQLARQRIREAESKISEDLFERAI